MGLTERKRKQPKGKKGRRKPVQQQGQDGGTFAMPDQAPRRRSGGKPGMQNNLQAGLDPAQRLLKDVTLHGSRSLALERLTNGDAVWAEQLREWKDQLVVSLGGWDVMSPECHEILGQLAISKVIVDSLAAYAVANAPINKQKHKVFPWVTERDKLVASYINLLKTLRETVQATKHPKGPPGWNREYDYNPDLDGPLGEGDA